jgi:hypothetical protein
MPNRLPRLQILSPLPMTAAWLPLATLSTCFDLVDDRPDLQLSVLVSTDDLSAVERADPDRVQQLVVFGADNWDDATDWHVAVRAFIEQTDTIVFGTQLPVSSPVGDRMHPLLCPSMVEPFRPKEPATTHDLDLVFVGDFAEESTLDGWVPPSDDRDLRSWRGRAYLVNLLLRRLPQHRLLIERRTFWDARREMSIVDAARMITSYRRALMRAAVCFAPYGMGYNTLRHSDVLAIGGVLLTPPMHEVIRVPEPELWASEEICVLYAPDGSDLLSVADRAIASSTALQARRQAAFAYYEREGTALARIQRIATVLAAA